MAPGKPRHTKNRRGDYVYNRSAPHIASLPRATEELAVAYRIFSPGLDQLTQLESIAADVSYRIENGGCTEIKQSLGISNDSKFLELYKKSYAVYAAEIKRMKEAEEAEDARLAEELAAREARKKAQEESQEPTVYSRRNDSGKRITIEQQKVSRNDNTHNHNKRRADDESTTPCPKKRIRHCCSNNDTIPDPYWLSKADAQANLDTMNVRAKNLETSLTRLQDFYHDICVKAGTTPDPTISGPLARADTQIRQNAIWYVEELQRVMAGAPSTELSLAAGWEWKRDRFDNSTVRGLIERIREFGARLVDTEKEMASADLMREEFVLECAKKSGVQVVEGVRDMFLEDWAKQLLRITQTVAHEAREYVSFRTMEAEWANKWAQPGVGEHVGDRSSPIVIDSSDSDDDSLSSLFGDSEDDLEGDE
ncbi:hypothetical protein N0V82_006421 [Gnomoniopsis sp. IMI 355080]|nr:hypothetical protein N0V82_006421 [Gnomoniopsis sp. IMI 355080]